MHILIKSPRTDPKRIHKFHAFYLRNINASIPVCLSVCQSVFRCVWAWSRLSEVSEGLSQALYKVTTPSKRSGLHKRTFYDSASQTCSARSSKLHASGEAGCGWKFQRKTRIRERMERKRDRKGGRGDMKGKANPQKPFDISHQSKILTFLTLHFQLSAKSSTWGCHSLCGRSPSSPPVGFDRSRLTARVFKGTHLPATCWGFLQKPGNVI